ncbi:MAG: ATP-binding cassette domain-containing protein [Enterocloster bolteae]
MAENTVILRLDNVSRSFAKVEHDEVTHALNEVNLSMKSGEFISLVGPSGCGKSTITPPCGRADSAYHRPSDRKWGADYRAVAGAGNDVSETHPFSMADSGKNVSFSLKLQGKLKGNEEKVERMLKIIGLESFRNDYPGQLSGGMAQRVSLVRSLINEPDILLLSTAPGSAGRIHTYEYAG